MKKNLFKCSNCKISSEIVEIDSLTTEKVVILVNCNNCKYWWWVIYSNPLKDENVKQLKKLRSHTP